MARNTKKNVTLIVCRLCLVEVSTVVPIFTSKNVTETSSLQMKIMELANVQVYAGDGLPSNVCFNCSKLIESYHAFKVQIEKSDVILRHQLSSFQTDPLSVDSKLDTVIETNHEEIVKAETFFIKDEADVDEEHVESILHPSVELSTKSPVPSPAPPLPEDPPDNMEGDDNDEDDIDNDLGEVDDDVMDEDVDDDDDEEDDDDDNVDDDIDPFGDEDAEPDSSSAGEKGTEFTKKSGTSTESEQTSNILFQSLTKGAKKTKSPKKSSVVPSATVTSASVNIPTTPSATVTSGSLSTDSLPIDSDPGPSTSKSEITESGESSSTVPESQVNVAINAGFPLATDFFLTEFFVKQKKLRKNKSTECAVCGFVAETYVQYLKHIEQHSEISCNICKKSFKKMVNLRRHKQDVHSENLEYLPCEICGNLFKSLDNLRHHIRRIHISPSLEHIKCSHCEKSFKNKISLNNHVRAVHETTECVCNVCNKPFKNLLHLRAHMYGHSNEGRVCEICGKYVRYIRSHMSMVHAKHVKCEMCGNMFRSDKYLKRHIKYVHSNIGRDYVCDTCGAAFTTKIVLTNHFLTHSDERKHKCHICDKSFKTKDILKTHQRVHNDNNPYICVKCGEAFKWKGSYLKHSVKCQADNNNMAMMMMMDSPQL